MEESQSLIWVGYIVLVVLVFLGLFGIMNKMVDNSGIKQELYARDASLIESILLTNNYDHNVSVNIDSDFEYSFNGCSVLVNKKGTNLESAAKYFCADNLVVNRVYNASFDYDSLFFKLKDNELSGLVVINE
ncbi:MAG: hypothetical protein ABIH25_02715 [Candidatus Woesearchaeota archaeon]